MRASHLQPATTFQIPANGCSLIFGPRSARKIRIQGSETRRVCWSRARTTLTPPLANDCTTRSTFSPLLVATLSFPNILLPAPTALPAVRAAPFTFDLLFVLASKRCPRDPTNWRGWSRTSGWSVRDPPSDRPLGTNETRRRWMLCSSITRRRFCQAGWRPFETTMPTKIKGSYRDSATSRAYFCRWTSLKEWVNL